LAAKIYPGEDDIKTINAVGGSVRAAYLHEKQEFTRKYVAQSMPQA
jgi:hypothetical protein